MFMLYLQNMMEQGLFTMDDFFCFFYNYRNCYFLVRKRVAKDCNCRKHEQL